MLPYCFGRLTLWLLLATTAASFIPSAENKIDTDTVFYAFMSNASKLKLLLYNFSLMLCSKTEVASKL